MLQKTFRTIHRLRVLMFLFILISSLYALGINPIDATKYLGVGFSKALGVGQTATIKPNPFNTVALQLEEKEKRLNLREESLKQKEAEQQSLINITESGLVAFLIGGIIVLFGLISLNFFLDWKRRKVIKKQKAQ